MSEEKTTQSFARDQMIGWVSGQRSWTNQLHPKASPAEIAMADTLEGIKWALVYIALKSEVPA